jgi:hypothetical protein
VSEAVAPLGVWHPAGPAATVRELGAAEGAAELLLAPEAPDADGLARAGADAVVAVAGDTRAWRRVLGRAGFERGALLLQLPDRERSRFVVSLGTPATAFALREVLRRGRGERAAARLLPLPGLARLAPTTALYRRPGRPPLLDWLGRIGDERAPTGALVVRSWRRGGGLVVLRFDGREPDLVVKLGAGTAESETLVRLGDDARGAGVRVAKVVATGAVGATPFLAQTPLTGRPADAAVAGSPAAARELAATVAAFLRRWNRATAQRRTFTEADGERLLLAPLDSLPDADSGYRAHLVALAERCAGRELPLVAAHNDLTAANLLVAPGQPLGLVDWEEAAADGLPLGDLLYATVDLAAAVERYADRPAALRAGLAWSAEAVAASAGALELDADAVELCVHACWLRHAANEERAGETAERPFRELLRLVAAGARP